MKKVKTTVLLVTVISLVGLFAACETDDSDDSVTPAAPVVIKEKAIPLAAPVTGADPAATVSTNQFSGAVVWKTGTTTLSPPNKFARNTAYTATITLKAKAGYKTQGVPANFGFTVAGASTVTNTAGTATGVTVTATFPATGGDPNNPDRITLKPLPVTAPITDAVPVVTFDTAQYTGAVAWNPAIAGNKFAKQTTYTATITLTPKAGWKTDVAANFGFTITGANTVTNAAGTNTSVVVTATFPKTGGTVDNPDVITIKAIAGVTAPATDGTPVTTITATDEYTGAVAWQPAVAAGGKFAGGTDYKAVITLTPKTGFTGVGLTENCGFTVEGANPVTNTAGTATGVVVTATFPETQKNVADVNITAQPMSIIASADTTTLSFTVAADTPPSGFGTLSYQWYTAAAATGDGTAIATGGTSPTLSLSKTDLGSNKYVYAVVKNEDLNASGIKTKTATSKRAMVFFADPYTAGGEWTVSTTGLNIVTNNATKGDYIQLVGLPSDLTSFASVTVRMCNLKADGSLVGSTQSTSYVGAHFVASGTGTNVDAPASGSRLIAVTGNGATATPGFSTALATPRPATPGAVWIGQGATQADTVSVAVYEIKFNLPLATSPAVPPNDANYNTGWQPNDPWVIVGQELLIAIPTAANSPKGNIFNIPGLPMPEEVKAYTKVAVKFTFHTAESDPANSASTAYFAIDFLKPGVTEGVNVDRNFDSDNRLFTVSNATGTPAVGDGLGSLTASTNPNPPGADGFFVYTLKTAEIPMLAQAGAMYLGKTSRANGGTSVGFIRVQQLELRP